MLMSGFEVNLVFFSLVARNLLILGFENIPLNFYYDFSPTSPVQQSLNSSPYNVGVFLPTQAC